MIKPETGQMLTAGWCVKNTLICRPDLEIQLAALVRDIWATAALVEGVTPEELEIIALSNSVGNAAHKQASFDFDSEAEL